MAVEEGGGVIPQDILDFANGLPDSHRLVESNGNYYVIPSDVMVWLHTGEEVEASTLSGVRSVTQMPDHARTMEQYEAQAQTPTAPEPGELEQSANQSGGHDHSHGDDEEIPEEPQSELNNMPPGGFIVHLGDGRAMWAIAVPGTQPPATLMYHIRDIDDYEQMIGDLEFEPVTFATEAEAEAAGYVYAGVAEEVIDSQEDPFSTMVADVEEQLRYSPMFGDPEIMALIAEARLEGRDVSDAELRSTDYWLSRTEGQRAWDELVMSGMAKNGELPAEAQQQLDSNRLLVQRMLIESGWQGAPPDSLVNYLADNYTNGTWTQAQLQSQVESEVDPYSPNASPFAGLSLGEDQYVVQDSDGNMFVRTRDGDYRLTGPGQEARYGQDARQLREAIPEGRHVVDAQGTHYFRSADGQLYLATGDGQIAGLQRLYGDAIPLGEQVPVEALNRPDRNPVGGTHRGDARGGDEPAGVSVEVGGTHRGDARGGDEPAGVSVEVAGTVVDLFGGAGGIEQYGGVNEVGVAQDVLVDSTAEGNSALGEVERVRQLVQDWLGPVFGAWDQRMIEEWAGRLRQNENELDVLVDLLRGQRAALFPAYEEGLRYVDIAAPWERMVNQYLGRDPGPADEWFTRLINLNDSEEARRMLMRQGLREENGTTLGIVRSGAQAAFGGANQLRSVL